jgi:hypothetical protein
MWFYAFGTFQLLDLTMCSINSCHKDSFFGLSNLRDLSLTQNKIATFEKGTFDCGTKLVSLNVSQ